MSKSIQMVMLIMSGLYLLIILGFFFFKERIHNDDTKIYKDMSIINLISILSELLLYLTGDILPQINKTTLFIFLMFSKIFVCIIICWFVNITKYTLLVCDKANKHKYNTVEKKNQLFLKINLGSIMAMFFVLIAPVEFILSEEKIGYTTGLATKIAFLIIITLCMFMLINLISVRKKIRSKEFVPIIILLLLMLVSTMIQASNPQLLLFNHVITLVMVIMFHTIENPDVKIIEQLNIAKDQAEKANRAKTEFLSSMSHEIRTPLNAIVGFSECMLTSTDLEENKGFAKDVVDASQNLLEIVNGILDISKIEANKMEIIEKEYNPREVFESLSKLVKPRIGDKPIEFHMNLSPDLPGILKGDVGKVKQVILNLLTNAAKYTDKGKIDFTVSCVNQKNKCLLYISVKDTGRGIKEQDINKLFTKFQRMDEDRNTTIEGTGLGLAITKSLTEMMNGQINVNSIYGEGSNFRIYLQQKIISMEIPENYTQTPEIDYTIATGKKILIVDDSKINLKVAMQIFKPYQFQMTTAESGFETLELLESNTYDIIFMDIMMPKMNGIETLRRLKEMDGFDIPVVALTADAIEGTEEKYKNAGFTDYLSKPIDKNQLDKVLTKLLGGKKDE